jgi:hypothetical protein
MSLLGSESANSNEHGTRVDGTGVKEQSAEDLLDVFGFGGV